MQLLMPARIFLRVIYWRLDRPLLLQTFEHVFDDEVPYIPRVHRFLNFWHREIEAAINAAEVDIGDGQLRPVSLRHVDYYGTLQ